MRAFEFSLSHRHAASLVKRSRIAVLELAHCGSTCHRASPACWFFLQSAHVTQKLRITRRVGADVNHYDIIISGTKRNSIGISVA
jgi:hypothetical protein